MPAGHPISITLHIPSEGITLHEFDVEHLHGDLFRILEVPSAILDSQYLGYRDVAMLQATAGMEYELIEIHERAAWRRFDFIVPAEFLESAGIGSTLSRTTDVGGTWVRDAGGDPVHRLAARLDLGSHGRNRELRNAFA